MLIAARVHESDGEFHTTSLREFSPDDALSPGAETSLFLSTSFFPRWTKQSACAQSHMDAARSLLTMRDCG